MLVTGSGLGTGLCRLLRGGGFKTTQPHLGPWEWIKQVGFLQGIGPHARIMYAAIFYRSFFSLSRLSLLSLSLVSLSLVYSLSPVCLLQYGELMLLGPPSHVSVRVKHELIFSPSH